MADIKIIVDSSDVVEAANDVKRLDGSVNSVGRTSKQTGKSLSSTTRGMNQFGAVAKNGGKKLNTFNMQIQQGGYQLQDFVVQLQGGTSVFTAFGQQGSQFAGVFGHKGAVIGAVIAIGSAVGGMAYKMLTAGEEVRDFQEILEDTSDILEKLADANKSATMSNKELEDSFGTASVQIKSTLALLRSIAENEAQGGIDKLAASLTSLYEVRGDGDRRTGVAELFDVGLVYAVTKAQKAARKEARSLTAEFVNAQYALSASEGNIEGQIVATQRLLDVAITLANVSGDVNDEEEALIKKLSESLLTMRETQTVKEEILSTYEDILGTEEALAESTEALNELFEARLGTIDDTANLYEDILGSSKGLFQAETALNNLFEVRLGTIDDTANNYVDILGSSRGILQAETALNKLYSDRLGTIDDTANSYEDVLGSAEGLALADEALNGMAEASQILLDAKLEEQAANTAKFWSDAYTQINESKIVGQELADAAYEAYKNGENLSKLDLGVGVNAAALAAGVLAKNLNISLQAALTMINLAAGLEARVSARAELSSETSGTGGFVPTTLSRTQIQDAIDRANKDATKTSGGGGKSPQEQLAEYLEGKRQELELETKLVGIFGSERTVKSELFEIEQKYRNLIDTTQDSQLAGTLRQIEAEKERNKVLKEAVADQQSIADTLQSSMSDAFMSMVDGTKSFKDAMKDMARSVIKQLYEVLVVQQMVGNFNATTKQGSGLVGMIMGAFQADGGAWQGGSQIQAYANGGVVGGPTTFPMAGGKTGLMGEAGPEAIMPLKRGSNGKLGVQMEGGGGGDVININQSFNFQANGDDSVKKLIAQAAPKIADMAKASVIDSRRRGGSTKAAFG